MQSYDRLLQRRSAASFAIWRRRSVVSLSARALPPFLPNAEHDARDGRGRNQAALGNGGYGHRA